MISINNKIKKWIYNTWETKAYLDYDDLHIDIINKKLYKKQKKWFFQGIEYLKISEELRKKMNIPIKVFLAFSLKDSKKQKKICIANINDLMKEIDETPPSLYLLEFSKIQNDGVLLKNTEFFFTTNDIGVYYLQFLNKEEKIFRRSLWLFINNKSN